MNVPCLHEGIEINIVTTNFSTYFKSRSKSTSPTENGDLGVLRRICYASLLHHKRAMSRRWHFGSYEPLHSAKDGKLISSFQKDTVGTQDHILVGQIRLLTVGNLG